MENQPCLAEQKLTTLMKHISMGIVEIDSAGKIIYQNLKAETLLKPILVANNIKGNNFFAILQPVVPSIVEKIKAFPENSGDTVINELCSFSLIFGGEKLERHYHFTVTKIADCILISFDDVTEKYQKERAMLQLASDKAVMQGKFEIASNVLHDIGNAVVGFGSYITRIKRTLEENKIDNLQKLSGFFATQQKMMTDILGKDKAEAVVGMLNGITESQKNSQEDIRKSINEQIRIITHIQEILNIQRLYLSGHESIEKRPIQLRSIINDCMSMLLASIEKRGIKVKISVPEKLPAIEGDHTRLMQVILNILKNSIEAIDITATEKNISLEVKACPDALMLQVKDNGTGFDKETGKKLFVRGFTTKATGTGLGLVNCRTITEAHDGTIDIASDGFGKGAVTTLKFKV